MSRGRQSLDDNISLTGGEDEGEILEAAGRIMETITDEEIDGSVEGSGDLGLDDKQAREEGFHDHNDRRAQLDAAVESVEDDIGRTLTQDEFDAVTDEVIEKMTGRKLKRDKKRKEEGDEGEEFDAEAAEALESDEGEEEGEDEDEGEEGYEDEEEGDETRTYEYEDILKELGEGSLIRVKIDGEMEDVPIEDLIPGYSRTASWTKKSQVLADERRAVHAEADAVKAHAVDYQQKLAMADHLIRSSGTPEQVQALESEFARVGRETAEYEIATKQRAMADEAELLLAAIPEWQDTARGKVERDSMIEYAINTMGFSEADLGDAVDHRAYLMMRKAMLYDQAVTDGRLTVKKDDTAALKAKIKRAKVLKPGQPNRRSASKKKGVRRAAANRDRLRRTGSEEAGAASILDILGDDI